MTIVAWGTTIAELHPGGSISASDMAVNTTAAQIAPYVVEGVTCKFAGAVFPKLDFPAAADMWFSWYNYPTDSTGSGTPIAIIKGGGVELFRIFQKSGGLIIEYHNGSSWTESGTLFTWTAAALSRFDFHVVIHDSTGTLTIYKGGTEQTSTTFSAGDTLLRGESNMDQIVFDHNQLFAGTLVLSAAFASTTDSRNIDMSQRAIDGAGGLTDWAGDNTDVDETGVDTADKVTSDTTTEKESFTFAALHGDLSGDTVIGVGLTAWAKKGSSGPANLQLGTRHNSVNGFGSNIALGVTYAPHQELFTDNPDTTNPWTFAEADGAEVALQAIT